MKRRGWALLLCSALLATLALLAACGNGGSEEPEWSSGGGDRFDGTYYRYDGGEVCRQDVFLRLDGDVWTDEEGHTGKCRFSGDSVTLLYELHWADSLGAQVLKCNIGIEGDTVHLYTGTIGDGRMELTCITGGSLVYYLEGKITGEITEVSDGGERSEESYGGESVADSAEPDVSDVSDEPNVPDEPDDPPANAAPARLDITVSNVEPWLESNSITPTCDYPVGALLLSVEPSSAAYRAGLRQFDIVTEFAGRAITCRDDLVEELSCHYAGEVVSVTVFTFSRRFDDGEVRTVSFALDPAS